MHQLDTSRHSSFLKHDVHGNIQLGGFWGRIYDRLHFFLEYIPFVVRTDIRFVNPWECREALSRQYEMVASFIPARGDVVFDVGAHLLITP